MGVSSQYTTLGGDRNETQRVPDHGGAALGVLHPTSRNLRAGFLREEELDTTWAVFRPRRLAELRSWAAGTEVPSCLADLTDRRWEFSFTAVRLPAGPDMRRLQSCHA